MFSSCMIHRGGVSCLGEGGVGVFVGGGGRFKSSGSTNEYSDVLVEGRCSLE